MAFITGMETRQLRELGSIQIPRRLEQRGTTEHGSAYSLFVFERIANGFQYMGSSTPVREKLVIAAWSSPASYADARKQAILAAQDRTRKLQWLDASTSEGIHEVNTHETPAWVMVRESSERRLLVAYMVWKKDAPASAARVLGQVDEVLASFAPGREFGAYWKTAEGRPAAQRNERMKLLDAALAKRHIRLTLDGGPVEHQGGLYELYTEPRVEGRLFTLLLPMGEIRNQAKFLHLRPAPPRRVGNWPSALWFVRENGKTVRRSYDGDLYVSDRMLRMAGPAAEGNAKFYVAEVFLLDDLSMPEPHLDFVWEMHPLMAELFKAGKLVDVKFDGPRRNSIY